MGAGASDAKPPIVIVETPITREVADFEDFVGQTMAVMTIDVRARVTGYLDKGLTFVGHLQSEQGSAATYAATSEAVNGGTPPCIRIGWSGGGGHFIGVYGIEPTDMLWVTDPIYGESLVSYSTLTGGTYQGNGTWTNTYFTH